MSSFQKRIADVSAEAEETLLEAFSQKTGVPRLKEVLAAISDVLQPEDPVYALTASSTVYPQFDGLTLLLTRHKTKVLTVLGFDVASGKFADGKLPSLYDICYQGARNIAAHFAGQMAFATFALLFVVGLLSGLAKELLDAIGIDPSAYIAGLFALAFIPAVLVWFLARHLRFNNLIQKLS